MKISKERVEQILPQNIKETTLLSNNAKNVLAMLMHSLTVSKGAQDSGVLVISNNKLRALLEMNRDDMLNAIRELEEYELITRIVGKSRTEGEPSRASEYHFNWDNIFNKPLKKKTSEELFSKFFKPSGTPSGTAITTTIPITTSTTTTNTTTISTTNTTKNTIENTNSTLTTNSIENSTTYTNTTEKKVEVKKNILEDDKGYSEEEFESFKAEIDSSLERCINEDELREIRSKLSSKNEKENALNKPRLRNRISSYIQSKYESLQHQCAVATSSNNNYDDELPF